MSHRADLYTVRVKEKWHDFVPLGDIDGSGTALIDELEAWLSGYEQENEDGTKLVVCEGTNRASDEELELALLHGESGVAAEIRASTGQLRLRQTASDNQLLRSAALFVLPETGDIGFLAIHINNNRRVKSLLESGLLARFAQTYDDLSLQINPFVQAAVFEEAVAAGRIETVRLVRYEAPDDRAVGATQRWVTAGTEAKIEVSITPRARARYLRADLVRRFLRERDAAQPHPGQSNAYNEIIEFQGITFDEAKIEVELANGLRRTFNLDNPAAGHALSVDLEVNEDDEGEPSLQSVLSELRAVLGSVR